MEKKCFKLGVATYKTGGSRSGGTYTSTTPSKSFFYIVGFSLEHAKLKLQYKMGKDVEIYYWEEVPYDKNIYG